MICAAPGLRYDVVYIEYLEWEVHLTPVTPALLLPEEDVLVLPVIGESSLHRCAWECRYAV